MNNRQVAEAFANGERHGRGSNLFIDGDTIYSYGYHFPIARHTDQRVDGVRVVLFNSRGYSVTTSKHKSYVRGALGSQYKIVEVNISHDLNEQVEELEKRLQDAEGKKARARTESSREVWDDITWNTREQLEILKEFQTRGLGNRYIQGEQIPF